MTQFLKGNDKMVFKHIEKILKAPENYILSRVVTLFLVLREVMVEYWGILGSCTINIKTLYGYLIQEMWTVHEHINTVRDPRSWECLGGALTVSLSLSLPRAGLAVLCPCHLCHALTFPSPCRGRAVGTEIICSCTFGISPVPALSCQAVCSVPCAGSPSAGTSHSMAFLWVSQQGSLIMSCQSCLPLVLLGQATAVFYM